MEIGPLVPEKTTFKCFIIYGHTGHLVHVTNIILKPFHFSPKSFHTNFGKKLSSGSLEKQALILICKLPWTEVKKMTLTLNTLKLNKLSASTNFQVTGCIVSKKSTVLSFDLAVKKVKVNPVSLFDQTMIGRSPRCYIPSFVDTGLPDTGAWQPSWSCDQHHVYKFSMYPKVCIKKFGLNGPMVSEKSQFYFSYVNDLQFN